MQVCVWRAEVGRRPGSAAQTVISRYRCRVARCQYVNREGCRSMLRRRLLSSSCVGARANSGKAVRAKVGVR